MRRSLLSLAIAFLLMTASADAGTIVLGPGTGNGQGNADTAGTRANIDLTAFATLGPGTYTLQQFNFQASQAGDAQPFVAIVASGRAGSGNESYQVIAAGTDHTVSGAGIYSYAFGNAANDRTTATTFRTVLCQYIPNSGRVL
jgi:hypothetical protein